MYLTRIDLKPCTYLNFLKKSSQNMHAAVAEAFDGTQERWNRNENTLWVVSRAEATSPQSLPGEFHVRDLDGLDGMRVAFSLKAEPTRSVRSEQGRRGKRVVLRKEEDQLQWLLNRSQKLGIGIETVRIVDAGVDRFDHKDGVINICWVKYEGTGVITDPVAFMDSIHHGIGHRGAWGYGMMLITKMG